MQAFLPRLYATLIDFMTKASDETIILTGPQMKDLFKLGIVAIRQSQKVASPDTVRAIWQPDTWDTLHKKLTSSGRFGASVALLTMCKQMAKMARGTTPPSKPKSSSGRNGFESVPPLKRKADGGDKGDATARKTKRKWDQKAMV